MTLSPELIAQFVKATNDTPKQEIKNDSITYGTLYKDTSKATAYTLKLDGHGADVAAIPINTSNIAAGVVIPEGQDGARVVVLVKNHTITVVSSLEKPNQQTTTLDVVGKLDIEQIEAQEARIGDLEVTSKATVKTLEVTVADVEELTADYGEFKVVATEQLTATDAFIKNASVTFANIDFSNIGNASIDNLFSKSGLIENVTVGDGTITGTLVGVTIKGDLIEGGTIVADKLVIQGEDGLYYKLNTNGVTTEAEQTEYNSIDGSIITAKSITATKISVSDLVAFDATIGGFTITDDSIYSEVKDANGNTTRGIHLGADGQINFGDQSNFIKYYKDTDGTYKLAISAASILYSLNGKQHSIADIGKLGEYVHIGTYEGEPCIELGEGDSDFKLVITNTRILFMEGSSVPAHINNQSLHITKAIIEEEIQQGEFVWKVRANGNLGLMWKGEA